MRDPKKITTRMIFRLGGASLRHQVILVAILLCSSAAVLSAYAFFAVEVPGPSQWITPVNILTAVMAIFSLGMLREQFAETKRRLEALEQFTLQTLPKTYVRKDVYEAGGVHVHARSDD